MHSRHQIVPKRWKTKMMTIPKVEAQHLSLLRGRSLGNCIITKCIMLFPESAGLSQTQHLCSWQIMFLIPWIGPVTFPINLNCVNTTKFPGSTPPWVKNHHLCSHWPGSLWFYFMSFTTFSGRSWASCVIFAMPHAKFMPCSVLRVLSSTC